MKIFKIFTAFLCLFSIVFSITIGMGKIGNFKRIESTAKTEIILSVWQIDTFEGGTGSRRQFLTDVAKIFEKNNQNVLVTVTNHTITSAENSMNEGVFPDVISYGNGLELKNATELDVGKYFKGGKVDGKQFAIPWCRGGYFLIANAKKVKSVDQEIKDLIVSQSEYTLPRLALYKEKIFPEKIMEYKPIDAYVNFVSGRSDFLLGTQRDIERLGRRGMEVLIKPITSFNDLYQYVSVCSKDQNEIEYAESFVKLLLSEEIQLKLSEIKMASEFYKIDYSFPFSELQKEGERSAISSFVEKGEIIELQNDLRQIKGESDTLNFKINKVLI